MRGKLRSSCEMVVLPPTSLFTMVSLRVWLVNLAVFVKAKIWYFNREKNPTRTSRRWFIFSHQVLLGNSWGTPGAIMVQSLSSLSDEIIHGAKYDWAHTRIQSIPPVEALWSYFFLSALKSSISNPSTLIHFLVTFCFRTFNNCFLTRL